MNKKKLKKKLRSLCPFNYPITCLLFFISLSLSIVLFFSCTFLSFFNLQYFSSYIYIYIVIKEKNKVKTIINNSECHGCFFIRNFIFWKKFFFFYLLENFLTGFWKIFPFPMISKIKNASTNFLSFSLISPDKYLILK